MKSLARIGLALRSWNLGLPREDDTLVLGVDGCRAGWLAIRIDGKGHTVVSTFETIESLWDTWGREAEALLVDVPIGLSEEEPARECDRRARALLKAPRASSVFNPPVRAALAARSVSEAKSLNEAASGRKITQQTWAIVPKIREVDQFLRCSIARQRVVREVHPEVLFHLLNDGVQLRHPKRRTAGINERLGILERHFAPSRAVAESAFQSIPRRVAKRDDIVDALSAAVVGFAFGDRLGTIPERPRVDGTGLTMEMVIPVLSGR